MKKVSVVLMFVSMFFISCSKDSVENVKSAENSVLSLVIPNIVTKVNSSSIDIEIQANTLNLNLETVIKISDKATLNYSETSTIDYNTVKEFIVTAENGTQKTYTINIIRQEGISLAQADAYDKVNGIIDATNKTIIFNIPKDILLDFNLKPTLTFEVTEGSSYTLSSATHVILDFDSVTKLTLTKKDGTVEEYDVLFKNNANFIKRIEIKSVNSYPDIRSMSISPRDVPVAFKTGLDDYDRIMRVLATEDVSNVVPLDITISYNATISPSKVTPQNFNQDVSYTVTSEAGIEKVTKVRVLKEKLMLSGEATSLIVFNASADRNFSTYFISISPIASLQFVNIDNNAVFNQVFTVSDLSYNDEKQLRMKVATTVPAGKYRLKATLENGDIVNTYYSIVLE